MTATDINPILVEATRGDLAESWHRGRAVVVDRVGRVVASWGEVERPILPRSAVKPLQALAVVESGAADAFALSSIELALACASHSGAPDHVAAVKAWLARLGLGPEHLVCGGHMPQSAASQMALARAGAEPSRVHDNCSGKHAAMLTIARFLGAAVEGYAAPDQPVQQRVRAALAAATGVAVELMIAVTDGCGVPTVAMTLTALAGAIAAFTNADLASPWDAAARRLSQAMVGHPVMVAGQDRFDTDIITATKGGVLAKGGAEGVQVAAIRATGLGLAIKIDDGAGRAAETAMIALLDKFGGFDASARAALKHRLAAKIYNRAGAVVGELKAVL